MLNQSGKIVLILILTFIVAGVGIYFFIPGIKTQVYPEIISVDQNSNEASLSENESKKYTSEDLEISFYYPSRWFVSEKNYFLLITSYATKIGKNQLPTAEQIEIAVHKPGGCHKTIDENLKDPACGEGGSSVKPNEIISKESEDFSGIRFYKYLVKYPNGNQQKFYFLEKGDRVLQIDKNPDPSQFEDEFNEVVRSIKFNE